MPDTNILGDGVTPYLIFSNAHDGSGMVKIAIVPLRIICQNQLNVAFKKAERAWNVKHIKSFESRLKEAADTLKLANSYMDGFNDLATKLATKKVTKKSFDTFSEELFRIEDGASDKQIEKVIEKRSELLQVYTTKDDLQNFRGTAWGLINAVSDLNTHEIPQKKTENWHENKFARMIEGYQMKMMDEAMAIINKMQ